MSSMLSPWRHWRGDIWRLSSTDQIHQSVTWLSNRKISVSVFHVETDSSSQRARNVIYLVCFLTLVTAETWTTSSETIIMEPVFGVCYISFLRGVPKWLLSRPAWDPEWLEDDVPYCTCARGSYYVPVWSWLWPGGMGDSHLSVRPLLELTAPILWKE